MNEEKFHMQFREGGSLTKKELIERLNKMEINVDTENNHKTTLASYYNNALKDEENVMKILDFLIKDKDDFNKSKMMVKSISATNPESTKEIQNKIGKFGDFRPEANITEILTQTANEDPKNTTPEHHNTTTDFLKEDKKVKDQSDSK